MSKKHSSGIRNKENKNSKIRREIVCLFYLFDESLFSMVKHNNVI